MPLTISPEPLDSGDAQRLVAALDDGLGQQYTPEQRFGPNFKAEQIADGKGTFLVARIDGRAIGCGGIRLLDATTAEVKRMYVDPTVRGQGVGWQILMRLESAAAALGVTRLVLETGIYQDAAIALYRRAGFIRVDCWGEYLSSATSVCYAKDLTG